MFSLNVVFSYLYIFVSKYFWVLLSVVSLQRWLPYWLEFCIIIFFDFVFVMKTWGNELLFVLIRFHEEILYVFVFFICGLKMVLNKTQQVQIKVTAKVMLLYFREFFTKKQTINHVKKGNDIIENASWHGPRRVVVWNIGFKLHS